MRKIVLTIITFCIITIFIYAVITYKIINNEKVKNNNLNVENTMQEFNYQLAFLQDPFKNNIEINVIKIVCTQGTNWSNLPISKNFKKKFKEGNSVVETDNNIWDIGVWAKNEQSKDTHILKAGALLNSPSWDENNEIHGEIEYVLKYYLDESGYLDDLDILERIMIVNENGGYITGLKKVNEIHHFSWDVMMVFNPNYSNGVSTYDFDDTPLSKDIKIINNPKVYENENFKESVFGYSNFDERVVYLIASYFDENEEYYKARIDINNDEKISIIEFEKVKKSDFKPDES